MPTLHPVLTLQGLDSEADRLRDERAGLPERARLEARGDEDRALLLRRAEAEARRAALTQEESTVAAEVADLAARAKALEDDLYSGRVTAAKDLEALQAESASWRTRQAEREERELEIMECGEQHEAEMAEIDALRAGLEGDCEALRAEIATQEGRIDGELARLADARKLVTPEVGDALLKDYEKQRGLARLGGLVMSHLVENTCGTCRVVLPVVEVSRIKAEGPGSWTPCPSCKRLILA